jgi:retinol dehydrogenase-12
MQCKHITDLYGTTYMIIVHYWAELSAAKEEGNIIRAMNTEKIWTNVLDRYFDTKLLNVFFARELANKLSQSQIPEDKKIVVSSCNPGLCMSPEDAANPNHPIPLPLRAIARDYPEGCKTHVFASIDPSASKAGQFEFYSNCAPLETADITLGKEGDALRERVWKDTLEVLGVTEQDFQL